MIIEGTVAPGLEPVRRLYERNMQTLAERNTQLCIYVGEDRVVDLWASAVDDTGFSPDSLVNVFSSGKSLESITLAMLADTQLIDFEARIADYWPEFGQHGKEQITLADLMRHEAGLSAFDESLEPEALHPANLRENAVGAVIERQKPMWRPGAGNEREYHAITRGWIANEVFRRVEPRGRTMGQFVREEVAKPLGIDVNIDVTPEQIDRISPGRMLGIGYQLRQSLIPRVAGRKVELNLFQFIAKMAGLFAGVRQGSRTSAPPPIAGMAGLQGVSLMDSPVGAFGETPSAGSKCSARGLAKLAAVMANGGEFGEKVLIGPQGMQALHADPITRNMLMMETSFTQGGLNLYQAPGPGASALSHGLNTGREGFYGWMGLGGSIFQWHPEAKIGFGYVPTSLNVFDLANERGKAYQQAALECVGAA